MSNVQDDSSDNEVGTTGSVSESPGKVPMGNYQKFADFMGSSPTMSIFRRYTSLNVQNLLFLQAEIAYLDDELKAIREEEQESLELSEKPSGDSVQSVTSWKELSEDETHSLQHEKILEIRSKLKEYNEALLQYHSVCSLHRPSKHDYNALCHWYYHPRGGDRFLQDVEGDAYDGEQEQMPIHDLVAMSGSNRERDAFTMFLMDNVMSYWYRIRRWFDTSENSVSLDVENAGLVRHDPSKLDAFARLCATLVASLLPPLSIFVLYFVPRQIDRLGIILAFSALFAFTLALFSRARPGEIFAATAAFASVQVVFIGTNGPTLSPG